MLEGKIVTKTSKAGKPYVCIEIYFPNGYTKRVFLDKAEEFMALEYLNEEE